MRKYLIVLVYIALGGAATAQTALTLEAAEKQFLENNLFLLAEHFNIDASKAAVIQAGLWQNPYFSSEVNAFNPEGGRILDAGRSGQKIFAIEQLIFLGGKKKHEVELAKTNAEIAELHFADLLRRLRHRLRVSYFSVYYDNASVEALNRQLNNLEVLLSAHREQAQKGNVPTKDVVRLQYLLMSLRNDRIELVNDIIEERGILRLVLSLDDDVLPEPTDEELRAYEGPLHYELDALHELAATNRPDLFIVRKSAEASQWNLRWQKAMAVPDLSLGAAYDQRGGAFNNQVGITIGMPIPILNRNQGNIKIAEAFLKQASVTIVQHELQVKSEVSTAYGKYVEASNNLSTIDDSSRQDFETVYEGVYSNFQKRNISMIEFTDFMESYRQGLYQYNRLQKAIANACEELNLVTATTIF